MRRRDARRGVHSGPVGPDRRTAGRAAAGSDRTAGIEAPPEKLSPTAGADPRRSSMTSSKRSHLIRPQAPDVQDDRGEVRLMDRGEADQAPVGVRRVDVGHGASVHAEADVAIAIPELLDGCRQGCNLAPASAGSQETRGCPWTSLVGLPSRQPSGAWLARAPWHPERLAPGETGGPVRPMPAPRPADRSDARPGSPGRAPRVDRART